MHVSSYYTLHINPPLPQFITGSFNLIMFLSLSFFEQPIWCYRDDDIVNNCKNNSNSNILYFGLPVLPPSITLSVEFICVLLLSLEMVAKARILGRGQFFRNHWLVFLFFPSFL